MRRVTAESGDFPTRPYDLVKELVLALAFVLVSSLALAAVFSSPDERPITLQRWAQAAPDDVVATAAAELGGTSASATYGPPYIGAMPSAWPSPAAIAAPYSPGGTSTPSDTGSGMATRSSGR